MTQTEALELMSENSREVMDVQTAMQICTAFGTTIKKIGITPQQVKSFPRLDYLPEDAETYAVAVWGLARRLAVAVTGVEPFSSMNGMGSYAQDITEKAVALLKKESPSMEREAS